MGLENDTPTGNTAGIDADSLLSSIEGQTNHDIPMTQSESKPTQEQSAPTSSDEIEFQHDGKPVKVSRTDPKFMTWLQQGYNYAQRAQALNEERTKFDQSKQSLIEAEKAKFEQQYSPYKTVDEYAKQNPEWWSHVQKSFENRDAQPNASDTPELAQIKAQIRQEIMAELKPIQEKFTSIEQREHADRVKAEDQALSQEIQSIQEQYQNLDWKTPDESGMTLEKKVIKHAIDNKIESFRAAFRDYSFDNLTKLHEERGKETVNQELQKRSKLGIIGQSPTPKKGIQAAEGVKNKSYNDIEREIREELGIA